MLGNAGAVTGDKSESTVHRIRRTYADKGIKVRGCTALYQGAAKVHVFHELQNGRGRKSGPGSLLYVRHTSSSHMSAWLQGFYPGGTAIAFRQMTNWASRQGFTEAVRGQFKLRLHGSKSAKLTKTEEVGSGILGGTSGSPSM